MTDAELTILSLLVEGPRYGSEIQQIVEARGLRDWLPIGFSSIYYILNKLERQNMLSSTLRHEGRGPARKLYELTAEGRGILQTAIQDLLRAPRSLGSGFELGLANLHVLRPATIYRVLSLHRDDLRQQYDAVRLAWSRFQKESPQNQQHLRALYTHSLTMMEAELKWMDEFLTDWVAQYPAAAEALSKPDHDPHADDPNKARTLIHRKTTPEPAKMLQRLKKMPKTPPQAE